MAEVWPATLPVAFVSDSYAEGIGDGRLRSETDAGPAKVRGRTSAAVRPLSGAMVMDSTQIATLRTFVEDTLIGGSLPFTFPDQLGGADLLVRFADGLPGWKRFGRRFLVSVNLEVLP